MTRSEQPAWSDDAQVPVGSPSKRRRHRTIPLSITAGLVVALSSAVALSPIASAAPSKIVVDGQDITQNKAADPVCDAQGFSYHIQGNGLFAVLSQDKTQIQDLDLMSISKQWGWAPGRPGSVQLTQSGNTYTFTGKIAPSVQGSTLGDPVPFEAHVTCP